MSVSAVREQLAKALDQVYLIEDEVGRGGMATVFRARDVKHGRHVALKVLRPEVAVIGGRFKREILLAAGLRHPHILPVYDSGEAAGLLYYVMPLVRGESLHARLRREGRLEVASVVGITSEVAGALAHAHANGIVHRDVKPANILLDGGHAIVADFGVALALDGDDREYITGTGISIGTPIYMSPEQIEAASIVDGRSDVYSLACVTFEMLAGAPPFSGPTPLSILSKRFTQPIPRVTTVRDDVSSAVDEVLEQALALDPDARFGSAGDFAAAVREACERRPVAGSTKTAEAAPSIAILPFASMSADAENEYFSDGITEDVINALCGVEHLRVASRTSSFAFKETSQDVRSIGRQLGVSSILEGSVRRSGRRLRVTVQLTDVATGFQTWSEQYDREMKDVFAIQDEISRAIVEKLKVQFGAADDARLARRPTASIEAYNLYLKGRYFWNLRGAGLSRAREYFQKAIREDPEFALAYSALADTYSLLGWYRAMAPVEAFPEARAAADRAVALDDESAEAHTSLAFVLMMHEWEWEAAEREFRRALQLNPGYATAHHWYAEFLMAVGRPDEAIAHSKEALQLDPLGLIIHVLLGMAYYFARRFDDAIEELTKVLEMEPAFAPAFIWLGQAYLLGGRYVEAIECFRTETELAPSRPTTTAYLAVAHAVAGEQERARTLLGELETWSNSHYVSAFDFALIHFALEQDDDGFAFLERAYEERAPWLTWIAMDPMFDRVRDDRRFAALVGRLGRG